MLPLSTRGAFLGDIGYQKSGKLLGRRLEVYVVDRDIFFLGPLAFS
jgi:hypothetical protein